MNEQVPHISGFAAAIYIIVLVFCVVYGFNAITRDITTANRVALRMARFLGRFAYRAFWFLIGFIFWIAGLLISAANEGTKKALDASLKQAKAPGKKKAP